MATETLKAKLTVKAKNGKGFKVEGNDDWFNATEKSEIYLKKIEVGKMVEITYFKKGIKKEVMVIKEVEGKQEPKKEETKTESSEEEGKYTNCAICGKELKGKAVNYPNCWDCKDKAPKEETKEKVKEEPKRIEIKKESKIENKSKSTYSSDRDSSIQRGNSLNSAGAVLKGNWEGTNTDPMTIAEATKIVAESFLDWLRAE